MVSHHSPGLKLLPKVLHGKTKERPEEEKSVAEKGRKERRLPRRTSEEETESMKKISPSEGKNKGKSSSKEKSAFGPVDGS